ncbi:MAG: DUF63 family protein [Candidatus Micrarchaeota archaeon]
MEDFIYQYYLKPIINGEGYNPINTATYAIIAIICLYLIFLAFKKYNLKVDRNFVKAVFPFVLFGSTVRVVTDAITSGVFKPVTIVHELILKSGIYNYSYFTVTPGIYIIVAFLLFASMIVLKLLKKSEYLGYVGAVLFVFHLLLLIPFMTYWVNLIPVLVLALIPALIASRVFKNDFSTLMVAGHALDGAATFWVIDVFGPSVGLKYFEQHVLGSAIGDFFGTYFAFYLVKILIVFGVSYLLIKEKEDENLKNFVALAIAIMGFAPGVRDILRMLVGG